jgi:glycosyltransferase involved in cell wall biosynthesis
MGEAVNEPSRLEILSNTVQAASRYVRQRIQCARGSTLQPGEKPHLLLLAWWFPPKVSGGVYRPLAFVRQACEAGWDVTVVSAPLNEAPTAAGQYLAEQIPAQVRVLRLGVHQPVVSHKVFPRIDGGFLNMMATVDMLRRELHAAPSVVLPSGPPFHNFAAGWMLSRLYRAPLVLDYRDEWTECPFDFVKQGNVDLAWERRCLRSAYAVAMTTDSFIEHALTRFPQLDRNKVHRIMNGWEPADMPERPAQTPGLAKGAGTDAIDIAYLGAVGDHAPIAGLLDAAAEVKEKSPALGKRLTLRFVGDRSLNADRTLAGFAHPAMLRLQSQVPKPEAMKIMQQASALLIINEPSLSRYIPGKLFDYIASGTPILVFGQGGEAARIVRELDAGIVVDATTPGAFLAAVDALSKGQIRSRSKQSDAWLAAHTRQRSAVQMVELLESARSATPRT